MDEAPYVETLEPGGSAGSPDGAGGSKLPPVLANLMGSMGAGKSPQGPGGGGINVQEILTSIMVRGLSGGPRRGVFRSVSCSSLWFWVLVVSGERSHCVAQVGLGQLAPCAQLIPVFVFCFSLLSSCCHSRNCHFTCSQGSPNSHPSEELLRQPDYSDKLKQMLGNPRVGFQGLGEDANCGRLGKQGFPS